MSQENVEIVRRAYEAVSPRDVAALDALCSEDFEFHSLFAASEGTVFRGKQGIRDFFTAIDEAFHDYRIEAEKLIAVDDSRVAAVANLRARGKGSGVPLDECIGQIWTLQDGEILRLDSWANASDALEAAGLSE